MNDLCKPMQYYVATEDGTHFVVFEETELIFEALKAYYQAINDGPEDIYIEIEMGYYNIIDPVTDDFEHEPLLYHEFTETN
jgi:hypothetical protein